MSRNKSLPSLELSLLKMEDSDTHTSIGQKLSNTFLILDIAWLVISFYLHLCLYRATTRIDCRKKISMIGNLLTYYSVLAPFTICYGFSYGNFLLPYNYPNSDILGEWFCYVNQYFCRVMIIYIGAFTLFTAAMKYWFIVHNVSAKNFGEERFSRIVLLLHLVVPITIGALHVLSTGNTDSISGLNRCWMIDGLTSGNENTTIYGTQSSIDIFCQNREYEVTQYLGENAAILIEPMLRALCIGVNGFYILTTCNMVELILYFLLFRRLDRLFFISEFSVTKESNTVARIQRKRRHDIRKVLLVLAYLIDCSAGVSLFCITTVGNKSILQERILVDLGFFTYAIPVPLAHLLSGVRVRTTIIEKGWYVGLKSIFQTSETIRNENVEFQKLRKGKPVRSTNVLEMKPINTRHRDALHIDNDVNHATYNDADRYLESRMLQNTSPLPIDNHDILSSNELKEYHTDRALNVIVHWSNDGDVESRVDINYEDDGTPNVDNRDFDINCIGDEFRYIDDSITIDSENEVSAYYTDEVMSPLGGFEEQINGSVCFDQPLETKDLGLNDHSSVTNTTNVSIIVQQNDKADCKGNDTMLRSLTSDDISKIKIAFAEHSKEVMKTLADENFAMFSKAYILRRTLTLLYDGATETLYRKHFVFICLLGGYPMMKSDNVSLPNFIVPLINAWYQTWKEEIITQKETFLLIEEKSEPSGRRSTVCDQKRNERKRILSLMLFDKNNFENFKIRLKELYDFEQDQEMENVDEW